MAADSASASRARSDVISCEPGVVFRRLRLGSAHLRDHVDEALYFFLEAIDGVEVSLGSMRAAADLIIPVSSFCT